jgi:hypothetical protein
MAKSNAIEIDLKKVETESYIYYLLQQNKNISSESDGCLNFSII